MPEPASTPLLPKEKDAARKKKQRLPFIQGLRFVAVGWIVLYHYCAYDLSSAFGRWATGFPLDMFTVVSGFVTHLAYRSRDVPGALAFLCQRSVRLIFIYYFSSILTLAIKMTNHSLDQSASVGLVDDLLAFVPDIFALNAWFALVYVVPVPGVAGQFLQETVFPTNAPLWYVQALAFCWIAYPTFHRAISSLRGEQSHIMMLAGLLFLASLLPLALYLFFPHG
jgi:peptidoglycan/LPS O-acetylase OafA/YrhL